MQSSGAGEGRLFSYQGFLFFAQKRTSWLSSYQVGFVLDFVRPMLCGIPSGGLDHFGWGREEHIFILKDYALLTKHEVQVAQFFSCILTY